MTPLRTWSSTNGSIIRCSSAMRLIQLSDLIDMFHFVVGPHPHDPSSLARSLATVISHDCPLSATDPCGHPNDSSLLARSLATVISHDCPLSAIDRCRPPQRVVA